MTVHLDQDTPEDLADAPDAELFAAMRATPTWDAPRARVVDYALRQKVVRALSRRSGGEELRALAEGMRRAILPSRRAELDALDAPWSVIWGAYAGLVERRVAMLAAHDPAAALSRRHVPEILQLVLRRPGIRQGELLATLGLKKGNLTRVLNLMEDDGLVERRAEGKENLVFPGPEAPSPAPEIATATSAPERPSVRPGASFFQLPAN